MEALCTGKTIFVFGLDAKKCLLQIYDILTKNISVLLLIGTIDTVEQV